MESFKEFITTMNTGTIIVVSVSWLSLLVVFSLWVLKRHKGVSYQPKPTRPMNLEDMIPPPRPLKEGPVKKGGINFPPKTTRPKTKPTPQGR